MIVPSGESLEPIVFLGGFVLSALISIGFSFFAMKRYYSDSRSLIKSAIDANNEVISEQLEPILTQNSKVMGIVGAKGLEVRQEKAALKALGEDIINDNEVLITALETISPMFAEKLRDNPDLIIKLAPRINAILERTGGIEGLLGGNQAKTYDNAFLYREE